MNSEEPTRVFLVDDELMFRDSVAGHLRRADGLEVVGHAESVEEAFDAIERLMPDVVFWDLWLQSTISGVAAIERTASEFPEVSCILLSHDVRPRVLRDALRAGAKGVLTKGNLASFLAEAVRRVAQGEHVFDQTTSKMMINLGQRGSTFLTPREDEIWMLFSTEGLSNKEVADRLGVTEASVRTYAQNLRSKLGVNSIRKAVVLWYQRDH